jgi:hypothetical protein
MRYTDIWALREKARESWDHVVSDKLIYFSEPTHSDLEPPHVLAKDWLDGNIWFEIHWTMIEINQREMHFLCVCERASVSLPTLEPEVNTELVSVDRNRPMFVHVPELIKLPEGITTKGVPSAIRLKRIEFDCHCGWEKTETAPVAAIVNLVNRELDAPLIAFRENFDGLSVSQCPRELVEGGSQTANEIADEHGNEFWRRFVLNPNDMEGLLEIVMVGDDVRLRVNPILDGRLKRLEVKLRPAGFHIYVDQPRRNAHRELLQECSTISA